MSQEIIIDGHNFIGCNISEFPNENNNPGNAREYLISLLSKYAEIKEVAITVVFDNKTNYENMYGDTSNCGKIKVMYSGMGQEADEVILDSIRKSANKKALIIVTSDKKDIGHLAGAEGCVVKNSNEFMRIIQKAIFSK